MPTIHLICGPTGADKTTFARELAAERGAVRFSIDEWMANLFAADTPPHPALSREGRGFLRGGTV